MLRSLWLWHKRGEFPAEVATSDKHVLASFLPGSIYPLEKAPNPKARDGAWLIHRASMIGQHEMYIKNLGALNAAVGSSRLIDPTPIERSYAHATLTATLPCYGAYIDDKQTKSVKFMPGDYLVEVIEHPVHRSVGMLIVLIGTTAGFVADAVTNSQIPGLKLNW